jgi:hypothetical protein
LSLLQLDDFVGNRRAIVVMGDRVTSLERGGFPRAKSTPEHTKGIRQCPFAEPIGNRSMTKPSGMTTRNSSVCGVITAAGYP